MRTNSGFTGVNDATTVNVTDGKKLVLIGEKDNASFNLIESTSTPTVRGGATLELGTLGLADGADYQGTLAAVNLGETNETGKLNVVNGNYTVNEIIARTDGSEVAVGESGKLNASTINAVTGADITNAGTLKVSGNVDAVGGSVISNTANMTVEGTMTAVGSVNNSKQLTVGNGLNVTGGLTNTGTLDVTGDTNLIGGTNTFANSGQASLKGDLTIAGTLQNNVGAFLETNKMSVTGRVNNYGEIEASDTSEVYGTLTNTGTIELFDTVVGQRGEINNTHTITGVGTITVNGLLSNVNNADFTGEDLVLTTVLAGSKEAGSEISTLAGGVPTITNEATMTFDNVTVGANTEFYNYGTTSSDTLTVEEGGYYINQTKPSTSGIMLMADVGATEVRRQATINGQYTNAGDAYLGTVDITATGVATNTGNLYTGESTQVVDGTGITIAAGGQLLNSGNAVLASSMSNAGTIRGDGTLTFKRGGTGTNIFANTGKINVGGFATDGAITYNQNGATSDFTSESGWFTNAVINLAEGTMSHENAGSGNTYNLGVQGDAVIANQTTATFDAIDSSNVFNIYTGSTLDVGTITLTENEKTVNLLGGTLSTSLDQIFGEIHHTALEIDANTPSDLVDVEGVQVATGVGDMKDSISQGVQFGWGTVAFDDAVYSASVVSDVLTKLDANDLAIGGHEGAGVEGGLQVTFNGQASQNFNVDLANGVKARPAGTEEAFGSTYAVFAGETLTNTTQAHPDWNALYVGSAQQAAANAVTNANVLDNSIGFKQVVNVAGGMTVADGRHFVFVGENQSVPQDYQLIDGDLSIVRGGLVTLGTYGTTEATKGDLLDVALNGGTMRVRHGNFTADAVTSAGTIYIGGDGAEHGGEILREDTTSGLTVESYQAQAGSELLNWGTFTVGAMTTAGPNSGALTNYGALDVDTATIDMLLTNLATAEFDSLTLSGGTLTNGADQAEGLADMTLTATALTTADGSIVRNYATLTSETSSISGRFENAEGANTDFGALTVAGKGLLANSGTVTADSITQTGGQVQNGGEMTIGSTTASSVAGVFNNTGKLTIEAGEALTIADGAEFTNAGEMTAAADISITGGTLTQNSDTAMELTNVGMTGGVLAVAANRVVNGSGELELNGPDAAVQNAGSVNFDTITVTQGQITGTGTLGSASSTISVAANGSVDQTNINADALTNAGSLTADNLALATSGTNTGDMSLSDTLTGDLTNNGELTIEGADGFAYNNGTLTNNGTFTATEAITLGGGHIVQASDTTATFDDLTINTGDLTVNSGKVAQGGTLTVSVGTPESVAVANEGTVDFDNINLTQGTISGSGTLGAADSVITVGENGIVDQGTVNGATLTNAGNVTADNLNLGTGTNNGVITADNTSITGEVFQNTADGEMNLTDALAGSIANAGDLNLGDADGFTFTSGTIENTGSLIGTGTVTVAGGTIHQASDTAASFEDLVINAGAVNTDAGKTVSGDSLSVNMGASADVASNNNGTMDFDTITVTQGQITGTGTLGSATSTITVDANGSVEQANVNADALTNAGSLTADNLALATSGTNTGDMSLSDTLTGDLTNNGELTIEGGDGFEFAEGTLTNNGTLIATDKVTLEGGHIVQASETTAVFDDLQINAGDLTVNAGKTVEGDQLIIRTDAATNVAVANDGTVDFNRITVESGSVTGTGTLGAADSFIGVLGGGSSVTQDRVEGYSIVVENDASITANDFVSHADIANLSWNEGVINAVNANFGDSFANRTIGEITISDSMTGNLVNIGTVTFEGDNGLTFTDGKLTNNGTLAATEKVTIGSGAEISQISKTEATFTDLLVQGGLLSVSADRVVSGDNLRVEMASGTDVGVTNNGTIDFGKITVANGSIEGTGTLGSADSDISVGVGGSIAQNQIIADELVNIGSITGNVTVDHGTQAGTITAGDLTVEGVDGQLVNTGTITTSGAANIAGLNNQNQITFGNGANFTGVNANTGTMTVNGEAMNVASGTTTVSGSGNLTVNAGLNIADEGKLTVDGENAVAAVTGGATIDGTFETSGQTTIDKVTGESSGTIVAAGGSLSIGDLTETDGMTFTQTADTNLVVDKGWFENSTINIEGGHFDASLIKDDEGNASGMLGHNTVNIGKADLDAVVGPDSELPAADKVGWSDKYVVVKVDTVTSDTTINVGSGGVLDVDNINLDGTSGTTITVGTGGGIQTSLDQFFEKVATTVTTIDAVNPETGRVDIVTDVIATTTVTDVKDSIKDGLKFENGSMVAWDDEDWSVDLVASTSNSLANAGLISEDIKVQQHFLGDFMGDFTVDTALRLEEEQEKLDLSYVLDPGVVFDTTTLHNVTEAAQDANKGLVIGGTAGAGENAIDYSIGFKEVANADYVDIEGGKEFVLVGEIRPDDFDWKTGYTDDNKLLTDAADGGTINVNDGTFTMGSDGLMQSTVGWVENANITENGTLVTKNGEFAAWNVVNDGAIDVTSGSILHTNTVTNTGTVHVAGGFTSDEFDNRGGSIETEAGSITEIGNLTSDLSSNIDNEGTITIGALENGMLQGHVDNIGADSQLAVNADMVFAGWLNNEGTAHYKDVTIELGSWTNSGYEQGEDLVVGTGTTHANSGTSIWNNATIDGEFTNSGTGENAGFKVGSDSEGESFVVNGTFDNLEGAKLDATDAEMTTVAGGLTNAGTAGYDDMTITEGGSSVNSGTEQGDQLVIGSGATHTNTGVSIWNGVTVDEGGTDIMGGEAENESFNIGGNYVNNGTVDASQAENVTIVGNFTNNGEADWDGVTVSGTSINNGSESGSSLTITEGGQHWVVGSSDFDKVTVDKGGLDQFGTEEKTDESYTIGGEYTNNGTINAGNAETIVVAGNLTNNGQALYDDMDLTGAGATSVNTGYEQGDILTVTDGAEHTNTGTSVWNGVTIGENASGTNGEAIAEGGLNGNDEGFTSDSVLFVGSEDGADETFNIAGEYVNNGIVQAENAETTNVTGSLANNGQAAYDDMTVAGADATSVNVGYEQGDILTVTDGAEHTNTGTSVWNGVTIGEGSSGTNGASIAEGGLNGNDEGFTSDSVLFVGSEDGTDDTFNIAGDYVNNGIVQAENAETTNVTGSLINNGQAAYDDMTVAGADATSVNVGYEQGDILTVTDGAEHTNTGTSVWNSVTIGENASGTNGEAIAEGGLNGNDEGFTSDSVLVVGSEDGVDDAFNIAGDYVNNGIVQADNAETANVTGSLTNNGQAVYDDMNVTGVGASSVNVGYEQGDILTVTDGAEHTNTGTSIWNNVTIGDNSSGTNGEELGDGPKGNEEGFMSDSILGIGSDAADETFVVAGDFTNHGVVDASKAEDTNVTGSLANDGQSLYDDMTITAGGSSDNSGYEKGDILTVEEGTHTNIGTSIWNNVTIGENASASNGGELAEDAPKGHEEGFESDSIVVIGSTEPDEEFNVDGDYANHGKLDASEAENTNVAGDLTNDGQAWYDDMTVENGGSSVNDGYEKGDILTVVDGGEHTNTGVSIWNNAQIDGSATNDGDTAVGGEGGGDEFVVNGDYTNNGNLDATDAENTVVAGDLDNNGHAEYDDMDINNGGTSTNDEYEKGDILDVNEGGTWDQNGESHWNNVNINEGGSGSNSGELTVEEDLVIAGDFDNTGDVDTGNLIVNDGGVLDLGDGSINADTTTVNGGDIIVGNHKELADENRVDYDTVVNGPINGHFWVVGNGDLSFGKDAEKLADELGVPDIPDVHNRLTVTQNVTIGETGSIAVGSDVWTDKDNHKDVGDGNLYFGADSTTVIDTSILANGGSVFTGTKEGATVTVEDGATLVLGNLSVAGDYVITSGFDTAGNTDENGWIGGWMSENALWAPTDAGSGLEWELTLGWDETKVWVNATLEDIRNKYPDISIPENVNDSLESCKNAGGPDQVLACTVIRNPDLTTEEKTRIINSVAEIGYASGAMAMAFNEATQAADSLEGRLSMKAEAFNRDGSMKDGGTGLWVDVLGAWTNADSYSVSGNAEIGYDADSYGIIMGVDHKLKDKNVILGGAFSYTDGSLTSTGDLLETKNSFKTFGIHAYGAWKPSEKTNLVGTLSYLRSASEATQKLPSVAGFGSASADIDTDLFVAGVRGEMLFNVGDSVSIVPHAGVRMVVGSTDGYDTKLDGQKAYGNDADTTTTFQVPVGVSVRADFETKDGWTVRPVADVTVIPQFGDTEQDTRVTGTSGATDEVTGQFTGDFATAISVGFQVESQKDTTIGFRYGLTAGEEGRKDHQLKFELRKLF